MPQPDQEEEDQKETVEPTYDSPTGSGTSKRKAAAEWFDIDEQHNTYVYVSGLPASMTEEHFLDLMKKYGIVAKRSSPGNPFNIKLYRNDDGSFKGDARCQYVRRESVDLALTHLDGYQYDDKHIIHCELAKFTLKGTYDPSKKPRIDPKTKQKQKKNVEKMLSWDTKEPAQLKQKKVILRHMFTIEELAEDASLIIDLRDDVESKCSELIAEPKRVDIYDTNPEGVIAVTFSEPEHAQACVDALNNQWYAGRQVTAELWDGKTKYKIKETDEESERRLKKFEQDIQETKDNDEDAKEKSQSACEGEKSTSMPND